MPSTARNENIDSFRGLLVLIVFLGHANLFFNAYRPEFRSEAGLTLIPWEHYSDGLIRLFLHPVAAAFIGLAGYTTDRFSGAKSNSFLFVRGLVLIILDLSVVSFAFGVGGFVAAPTIGVLSVTGVGLLISPLVRKLTLTLLIAAVVILKLTSILLPFSFLVHYPLIKALFYFYFGSHFYVFYAPLGWLTFFLMGAILSRLQKTSVPFLSLTSPRHTHDLFLVFFALGTSAALQKVFLMNNPQLHSFFQMDHYPAGNAYMMFSLAWAIVVFYLARAISSAGFAKRFLGHLARHGLVYYLVHLYVFALINWYFQIKPTGTFGTSFIFFTAFVICIYLVTTTNLRKRLTILMSGQAFEARHEKKA